MEADMDKRRSSGWALRMLGAVLCVNFLFIQGPLGKTRDGKEILAGLSWGDQIGFLPGDKPLLTSEKFTRQFREYKEVGVDTVLFRLDVLRWVREYSWPEPRLHYKNAPPEIVEYDQKQWAGAHQGVKENLLARIVDIAHEQGLRIFAYSTTFDEGMPLTENWYAPGESGQIDPNTKKAFYFKHGLISPMISKFTEAHPECVMVDRSQKKHNWGTLEFACPEARSYAVGYNRWYLENYPFDGVYIDFRNEFSHPEFGDQFGFGKPIVDEYKRRYGVDILREQFDLEKWRRLCGEYLTQFIRELGRMVMSRKKEFLVGIPQGDYLGLPNSNMHVDWRTWARERLVDGLVIGVITGKFIFPERVGYGYLTDMEDDVGLPNILWDLQNNYWPLCAQHRVKLYVRPDRGTKIPAVQFLRTNVDGLYIPATYSADLLKELR